MGTGGPSIEPSGLQLKQFDDEWEAILHGKTPAAEAERYSATRFTAIVLACLAVAVPLGALNAVDQVISKLVAPLRRRASKRR